MNRTFSFVMAVLVCFAASMDFAVAQCSASRGGAYRAMAVQYAGHPSRPSQVYPQAHSIAIPVVPATNTQMAVGHKPPAQASIPRQLPAQAAITPTAVPQSEGKEIEQAVGQINQALEAFRLGNNHQAIVLADQLIVTMPNQSDLLQFRSLIHLRSSDWTKAAADLYTSVQQGAIWSMEKMGGVYGDVDRYKNDLQVLRLLAESRPDDLATQFVFAYHTLVGRELDAARKSLQRMLTIKPNDPVAEALLRQTEAQSSTTEEQSGQTEVANSQS